MRYKVCNILSTSAVALLLGLAVSHNALALTGAADNTPGSVVLAEDNSVSAPQLPTNANNTVAKNNNVITPSAPVLPNNSKGAPVLPNNSNDAPALPNLNNGVAPTLPNKAVSQPVSADVGNNVPKVSSVVDSSVSPAIDPLPALSADEANALGDNILEQFDDNLFSKMSDIEKQSALLSLELRREKIKSEIAAIQAQRKKAEAEEIVAAEEREQKKKEWEAKQAQKEFEMKQKENEQRMQMEKLRQEKIVKDYKEQMLADKQKWVENTQKIYQEMNEIEEDRIYLLNDFKRKLNNLRSVAAAIVTEAQNAKVRHDKDVDTLKTQISILKARLEAAQKVQKKDNPFAQLPAEKQVLLSDVYAVMEIVGKGDNLVAKLINKNGDHFLAQKGTVLQSGHVVDEITETYVRADLNGVKDYLYFSAGGILQSEPASNNLLNEVKAMAEESNGSTGKIKPKTSSNKAAAPSIVGSSVPSLSNGLFVK